MATWQLIILMVWVWMCTRRPEKSKAEKNREEKLDYLIQRANLYRIGQAMEEWGLFYAPDPKSGKKASEIISNYE
jgi:hypothetical protein